MDHDLQLKLDEAWRWRLNQDLDRARDALVHLKRRVGLVPGDMNPHTLESSSGTPEEILPVCLLWISLVRAEGRGALAEEALGWCEAYSFSHFDAPTFGLLFQRGLSYFHRGDTSAALELFIAARSVSRPGWEHLAASTNALLCMENLSLPLDCALGDLREALDAFSDREGWPGILDQISAFEIRHRFRAGDLSFCGETVSEVNQSLYFRLWVRALPYHSYSRCDEAELARLSVHPWFYKRSYRLRTLQGRTHPDDSDESRLSEVVDRFYLWTWRWMTSEGTFPLTSVLSCLKSLDILGQGHRLTAEDACLIRNGLLWLMAWDPVVRPQLSPILASLRVRGGAAYRLLELEREVALWVNAVVKGHTRQATELIDSLRTNPLWSELEFWRLTEDRSRPARHPMDGLKAQLDLKATENPPLSNGTVRVLSRSGTVELPGGKQIRSRPLVQALSALKGRESLGCPEFLELTFGLPQWRPEIHRSKVQNLLNRLRKIIPSGLEVGMRGETIYCHGDWAWAEWDEGHRLSSELQSSRDWLSLGSKGSTSAARSETRPTQVFSRIAHLSEVNRRQLQEMTGVSKSTATRLITRWVNEGKLQKIGSARRTGYQVIGTCSHGPGENG